MSESLTTADVMAAYLAGAGVKFIFGLPGGQNIEFMEAARRQGLEFVLACREGTAALMADAAGQLTGVPGVCMSTPSAPARRTWSTASPTPSWTARR